MTEHPLIYLAGMPRSGTTWIAKIFDSHPDVLYRHEPDSRDRLKAIPLFPRRGDTGIDVDGLRTFVDDLPMMREEKVSASLPAFRKSYYSQPIYYTHRIWSFAAKASARIFGTGFVPNMIDFDRYPQVPVVWKSIESVGRIGLIANLFPKSHSLLILRHPCGFVASTLRGESARKFESRVPSSEDFGIFEKLVALPSAIQYGLSLEDLKLAHPLERLTWRWVLYNEFALTEIADLSNVQPIRYEDFCRDPVHAAQRAFAFCQLPWSAETETFIHASTSDERSGYYSLMKNPLTASEKWRSEIPVTDQAIIMDIVKGTRPDEYYN